MIGHGVGVEGALYISKLLHGDRGASSGFSASMWSQRSIGGQHGVFIYNRLSSYKFENI